MKKPWWLRLAGFAAPYWRQITAVSVLMLVGAGLTALKPWPMKLLVDYVFTDRELPRGISWLNQLPGGASAVGLCAWLAASTILIFAAGWSIQTLQAYIQSGIASRITYNLGGSLLEHLQRLSLRFHSRRPTGDLVRRVTRDSRCARDLMLNVLAPASTSLVTLVAMFTVMWQMDRVLSLVALLIIPALLFAERLFYGTMMERTYEQQQCEGMLMSRAERGLSALPVVQAFRRETHEVAQFRQTSDRTLQAYLRGLAAQVKFKTCVGGAGAAGRVAVMVLGGYRVLQGDLMIGDLLVFLAYTGMLYAPLDTLAQLAASLAACEAGARRMFEILDTQDRVPDSTRCVDSPSGRWCGDVVFEGVSFAYDDEQHVLRDINLTVKAGERIALVGHTGAGKSTLVALLLRFFDPCSGRITLDGIDLRSIPLRDLRENIAILLQDPFLLPVSVAENIAYGRPWATRDEIVNAAKAANAHAFIQALPFGYDTAVGDRGACLSGGERQRIAVARAILKDSPVLVLDEPTSALDANTEWQVMQAIQRVMAGRTTFVIAHRLSTIRQADRIVVLEAGKIAEIGTASRLWQTKGAYRRLYESQYVIPLV